MHTKEEADHSLPYLLAVAVLDNQVMPEQYRPDRIQKADVQNLLRRIKVRPSPDYSKRFPAEVPCRVSVRLRDGSIHAAEKRDYKGFYTNPINWDDVVAKFRRLGKGRIEDALCSEIIGAVDDLETIAVDELAHLLGLIIQG